MHQLLKYHKILVGVPQESHMLSFVGAEVVSGQHWGTIITLHSILEHPRSDDVSALVPIEPAVMDVILTWSFDVFEVFQELQLIPF